MCETGLTDRTGVSLVELLDVRDQKSVISVNANHHFVVTLNERHLPQQQPLTLCHLVDDAWVKVNLNGVNHFKSEWSGQVNSKKDLTSVCVLFS